MNSGGESRASLRPPLLGKARLVRALGDDHSWAQRGWVSRCLPPESLRAARGGWLAGQGRRSGQRRPGPQSASGRQQQTRSRSLRPSRCGRGWQSRLGGDRNRIECRRSRRPFTELLAPAKQLVRMDPGRSRDLGSHRARLHRRRNDPLLVRPRPPSATLHRSDHLNLSFRHRTSPRSLSEY
jgi:hypothetical protein